MEGVFKKTDLKSTNFAITTGSWKCVGSYKIILSIGIALFSLVS